MDVVAADSDTSFPVADRSRRRPSLTFDQIAGLVGEAFAGRAAVVGKAGPRVAARTREWLQHRTAAERVPAGVVVARTWPELAAQVRVTVPR